MPRKLVDLIRPVPSDIEIAQSYEPVPIAKIAKQLGLLPDELEGICSSFTKLYYYRFSNYTKTII